MKSFYETVMSMTTDEVKKRTLKHTLKERKSYVDHEIAKLEAEIDDLVVVEFDAMNSFIKAERQDTGAASLALENICEAKVDRAALKETLATLKEVKTTLFEEDGAAVSAEYGLDLTE